MVGSVLSGIKISAAASATTLSSSQMAVCTYTVTSISDLSTVPADFSYAWSGGLSPSPVNRVFGPSQTIPTTFTSVVQVSMATNDGTPQYANQELTATYTLQSGVILINTP